MSVRNWNVKLTLFLMNFQNMKFLSEQEIWRQTVWLSKLKNWNSVRRNEKLNHILMTWNTIPWNLKFTLWHICETYKSCMKIYVHSTMTCKQKTHYVCLAILGFASLCFTNVMLLVFRMSPSHCTPKIQEYIHSIFLTR